MDFRHPSEEETARQLEVLISDYEIAREDGRGLDQLVIALLSLAAVLIAGVGAIVAKGCSYKTSLRCDAQVWPPVYAFLPLGPLAALSVATLLGVQNTLRSYYLRALERKVYELTDAESFEGGGRLRLPGFTHLSLHLFGLHRGANLYRYLSAMLFVAIAVFALAITAASVLRAKPMELQIAGAIFYGAAAIVLVAAMIRSDIDLAG
jgi:hypothetical protein